MARFKLAIIIPAFNEEKTIESIVNQVMKYGLPIVINDGSSDDTAYIAQKAGAVVVNHNKNKGYDSALNTGFKKAHELDSEVMLTFDADGQHPASLIEDFIYQIRQGADLVVGIRNRRARFTEAFFSWISSRLWGISDPQCGMKAYRKEVYEALGYFDSYNSIGTELSIFAVKNGFHLKEVSFLVNERQDKPRFGNLISSNLKIFRAIFLGILK